MSGYICAFRGRRDDYQIPLALEEAGQLDTFITDAYAGPTLLALAKRLPQRLEDVVSFRYKSGLPVGRVRCLWGTTLREHFRHHVGFSPVATYARADQEYSLAAKARARSTQSNLLLYTPYAWEAFTASYSHQPKRVLFQYHPHAPYEVHLLRQDVSRYPEVAYSFTQETRVGLPENLRRRVDDSWKHADTILCASTFTKRTLLEVGADPNRCAVTAYGIEMAADDIETVRRPMHLRDRFQVLFVGSGVQRKGLHHLLRAWESANLPAGSSLVLVCRTLDPGLRERILGASGVRWLPGVNAAELKGLYQQSTLFAMPSLIEGFGQVYLESLSHGCPVLGTANTCLPDLGDESDGVFLTAVADIDQLVHRLEGLSSSLQNAPKLRANARACARRFAWSAFRAEVISRL